MSQIHRDSESFEFAGCPQAQSVINVPNALQRLGNDSELLRDMAGFFMEDGPTLARDVEQALHARDVEGLTRSAHSLKGLAANFDGEGLVEVARRIEAYGKASNLDAVEPLLPRLRDELARVTDAVQTEILTP